MQYIPAEQRISIFEVIDKRFKGNSDAFVDACILPIISHLYRMRQLVPEQWRLKAHEVAHAVDAVSYTHLDVYKRQGNP